MIVRGLLAVASVCAVLLYAGNSWAAYPSACKPAAGASVECKSFFTSPWIYDANSCSAPPRRTSESGAFADYQQGWTPPTICNFQATRNGWIGSPRPVTGCGPVTNLPAQTFGAEIRNASQYHLTWTDCATQVQHDSDRDAVLRDLDLLCARGSTLSASGYCTRVSNQLDPAKNHGKACPPCGNPVNPGNGNKYDNAGNTTSDGTVTFTYNDAGRMVSATKAGVTTTYALTARGT